MKQALGAAILVCFPLLSEADDWPMAGGGPRRSGSVAQDLPPTLSLRWTWHSPHLPAPAWPGSDRQRFDRAYVPVIAGGTVYFGSSADGKIIALDAATGRERWSFFTDGPCRFAPVAWKDRLFAVSDDGHLYCFAAATGRVLWKKRGGPDDRRVLGNDRIISRWPARGGPVVADDTVYFAAGIWPSDGIYLYALEAETGKVKWCNDQSGSITMPQPHGGANAASGVAAQGDLVIAGDLLLVPTGRAVPAAFRRSDGAFLYFHLQQNGKKGGASAISLGSYFINGGGLFDAATGALFENVPPGALAACPEGVVRSTDEEVIVSRIIDKEKVDRKGEKVASKSLERVWSARAPGGKSVISAGKSIVAGGTNQVSVVDSTSQKQVWSAEVEGAVHALAAADSRLYASTDQGKIHCFGAGDGQPAVIRWQPQEAPYGDNAAFAAAAAEIVQKTGVTEGYAVDLACGDGALAYELARRTKLQIYGLESDPEKVAVARRRLDAAGLYGVRVTVHQADPSGRSYPHSIAGLVVSGRSVSETAPPADAILRLQRPFGGVAVIGKPGAMVKTVRGAVSGGGTWTHQYADPANTSCSGDTVVRGPLSMHWFRASDFDMPQRHGRGPAPLFFEGRLIVEGLNGLRAVDAYTGRVLWEYPLPGILKPFNAEHLMGTAGTGSNLCIAPEGLYVHVGKSCLRIDPATGKKLGEFPTPGGTWGYLACENGTLYGTVANEKHIVKWRYGKSDMSEQFTESVSFFALDAVTGTMKWTYSARTSIRHNAIAVAGGKVFLIDRAAAEMDLVTADPKEKPAEHRKGELLALDAATGAVLWRSGDDIFGTLLIASPKHDTLLMAYQPTSFRLPSEKGGQMAAFRISDGKRLWSNKATYSTRPALIDRTLYANGGSWDLVTGEEQKFELKKSYGCGQMACSAHMAVYRSATMGYHDFTSSSGTANYGGIRLGCWINAVPAGGLVLVPDATTGCTCSYLNQAWIALEPQE